MEFEGTWHIKEMSQWDEDYFNMEVQAYIEVDSHNSGEFQFGLVSGSIDGKIVKHLGKKRFEFSWDGTDENDPASGRGWLQIQSDNNNIIDGEFIFFEGDESTFIAHKYE
ncbi:hypothetical protein [Candidatus Parabeggiatoa sp. HSG14]|uniref:hypothetical protein n=1 Tax=Candidatus Parabeggiatoa sp. HSG14 TaxID=3055593 RepID=UPI0025A6C17D|nr:hypothetical protein [Thiotrichales bacterium HSG14]